MKEYDPFQVFQKPKIFEKIFSFMKCDVKKHLI